MLFVKDALLTEERKTHWKCLKSYWQPCRDLSAPVLFTWLIISSCVSTHDFFYKKNVHVIPLHYGRNFQFLSKKYEAFLSCKSIKSDSKTSPNTFLEWWNTTKNVIHIYSKGLELRHLEIWLVYHEKKPIGATFFARFWLEQKTA